MNINLILETALIVYMDGVLLRVQDKGEFMFVNSKSCKLIIVPIMRSQPLSLPPLQITVSRIFIIQVALFYLG